MELLEDVTSSFVEDSVDSSYSVFWTLNVDQEYRFEEFWFSSELTSVEDTTSSWDNLTAPSVDSISVKCHIIEIKTATSHVLIAQDSLEMKTKFKKTLMCIQQGLEF